jgi:hypothetical protein
MVLFSTSFVVQISESVLNRCNKSNAQKLVNDLLSAMYNEVYLATHSLGGKSSKESSKQGLPSEAVEKIIGRPNWQSCLSLAPSAKSSDVVLEDMPWPRGSSRTKQHVLGLGLESSGLGLGLELEK